MVLGDTGKPGHKLDRKNHHIHKDVGEPKENEIGTQGDAQQKSQRSVKKIGKWQVPYAGIA